jgi:molecular chaperone DnaK (HSP70)
MGEVFTEEALDKFRARGLFRAKEGGPEGYEGDPVKVNLGGDWFLPQEISAFILMKMKDIAEKEIGEEIRDAVITVPAYFTEKQKKATKEAALLAGLYPRELIAEPTAAAICYGVDKMEEARKVYLVYDLGGGTFDVSIIRVEESNIEVVATSGNSRLGGSDFDEAITQWALGELKEKHQIDLYNDPSATAKIRLRAEQTKINLSTFESAKLVLADVLDPGQQGPPSLELTREKFEELIEKYLDNSLNCVDTAITLAGEKHGLKRENIDAILLVGGSTRIPVVKAKLLDYFQKDEDFIKADLNPDAVVARGAARMALRFTPNAEPFDISKPMEDGLVEADIEDDLFVYRITEHSLGVAVQGNIFSMIIPRGTHIPANVKKGGYTNAGPSSDIEVRVYQGEGRYCYENTFIGTVHLGPMEPKPEGFHQFEVTFTLDRNGLLSTTVYHINENRTYQARFDQKTGVGGLEALAGSRQKLLGMRDIGSATEMQMEEMLAQAAARDSTYRPPPPHQTAAPVPPPSHETTKERVPDYVGQEGKQIPRERVSKETADLSKLIEPTREVPNQFRSIFRRANKQLLKRADHELLEALNAFTSALNEGKPENELLDFSDDLEDVYHDCRTKAAE